MKVLLFLLFGLAQLGGAPGAWAHELRPAYLEITESPGDHYQVLWKVPAREEQFRLRLDLSLPEHCKILGGPQENFTLGAHLQKFTMHCPGGLAGHPIAISGLKATLTDVLVRLEQMGGDQQTFRLDPAQPFFEMGQEPGLGLTIRTYFLLGMEHILLGIDHLLFVLALLLLIQNGKRLIATITAFTVAHSLTLAAATLGWVSVPGPPVEAIIALSIVFVASEIIHYRRGRLSLTERYPWIVAFSFGLLHGLGFAGALSEIGLPQSSIPLALLFFNLGVEAGQLLFVILVWFLLWGWRKLQLRTPQWVSEAIPYAIGSLAMFWVIERIWGFF